jgi:hypothetical protein
MSYAREADETLPGFRTRIVATWVRYVSPVVPEARTRGRLVPLPLSVLGQMVELLDTLAYLGLIPERRPPAPEAPGEPEKPKPPRVRIPHIVEAKDGRVVYYLRNDNEPPTVADYERVARKLLPNARYRAYSKHITAEEDPFPRGYEVGVDPDTGYLRSEPDRGVKDGFEEGTALTYPFLDREEGKEAYYAEGPWAHVPMFDELNPEYHNQQRQLGRYITAGRLDAFGRQQITNMPPPYIIGWMVALIPLGDEGLDWLAMREGERNCVAVAIRESLRKGGKLTETRHAAIAVWESKVADKGAHYRDTDVLASWLKMRIRVHDVTGELLHEKCDAAGKPVYANGMKVINLFRSDGHCSTGTPNFPTVNAVVVDRAANTGPLPPPPGETSCQRRHREAAEDKRRHEYAVSVIKRHSLARAQIIGVEVVSTDGVVYRPLYLDVKLHEAAALEGLRGPLREGLSGQDLYESYNEEMVGDVWEPIELFRLGGVQALKFGAWIDRCGIMSLWAPSRVAWRMATIEAIAWTAQGASRTSAGGLFDMRAAYLACDAVRGTGPSRVAADRFGFPRGGRSRTCLATTVAEVSHLAGFIHFAEIAIAAHTPVAIAAHIASHFKERHAPIPIPAAVWLCEHGYLASYRIAEVEYTDRMGGIRFPNDRDLAVRMVGSCAYRDARRTLFTRDAAEKDHFAALYGAMPAEVADGFVLSYAASAEVSAKSKDHSHIRTYVLAYQAIAMWTAIEKLGDNLIGTSADSVLVRDAAAAAVALDAAHPSDASIAWGQFRAKTQPNQQPGGPVGAPAATSWSTDRPVTATGPAPNAALSRSLTSYLEPGGFGKTTRAIREADASGRRFTILVPTNRAQIEKKTDLVDMKVAHPENFQVKTFHQFFHCSPDNAKTWTPAVMGSAGLGVDGVIWDEYPVAGYAFLSLVLPWLRRVGICTVLCGDPEGQLQEFNPHDQTSGTRIVGLLHSLGVPFEYGAGIDWRAKDCPTLQAAKASCWCKSDAVQYGALRRIATSVSLSQMLAMWDPRDAIIEPTNKTGLRIEGLLEGERKKRFPESLVRCVFKPENREAFKKKAGVLPTVLGPDKKPYPAAVGSCITVTAAQYAARDKRMWKADSRITVHSVQGETIRRERKIFICLENMPAYWCRNALYVAMSRAELATQLYVFKLSAPVPDDVKAAFATAAYEPPDMDLLDLVYDAEPLEAANDPGGEW